MRRFLASFAIVIGLVLLGAAGAYFARDLLPEPPTAAASHAPTASPERLAWGTCRTFVQQQGGPKSTEAKAYEVIDVASDREANHFRAFVHYKTGTTWECDLWYMPQHDQWVMDWSLEVPR
jgi:hypothetical protein